MEELIIYPKKQRLLLMVVACLGFIGVCVYFIVYGYEISGRDSLGRFFKLITPGIFYIGAPLFTFPLIYLCYRLLKPSPSVVLNQEGIFDNASALGAGMVRWNEIERMFIYDIMGNKFLGIIPVNLEAILARQSGIKRFFFKMNKGMAQAPFSIPETVLPMKVEELLAKIELYRSSLTQGRA